MANDYPVEVKGSVRCYDNANPIGAEWYPLTGARVTIMDQDVPGPAMIFDKEIGHDFVQADGTFDVQGSGGDWGDDYASPPDVYLRIDYNGDRGDLLDHEANLTDDWGVVQGVNTKNNVLTNVSGLIEGGAWSIVLAPSTGVVPSGRSARCAVWVHAANVYREYREIYGEPPPAAVYSVRYWSGTYDGAPYSTLAGTHWVYGFPTGGAAALPILDENTSAAWTGGHGSVRDEFGHVVRQQLDGAAIEWQADVSAFGYAAKHDICAGRAGGGNNEGFAFQQGWAEYWSDDISPACTSPLHPALDGVDMTIEGNVAEALGALANSACMGAVGDVAAQKRLMLDVLHAHPGTIHSFNDFAAAAGAMHAGCSITLPVTPVGSPTALPFESTWDYGDHAAILMQTVQNLDTQAAQISLAKAAAEQAAGTLPACSTDNCHDAIVVLIGPHALNAALRHVEIALQRIEAAISRTAVDGWRSQLTDLTMLPSLDEQYVRDVAQADLDAYQAAVAALMPYHTVPEVADMIGRLNTQITFLTNELALPGKPNLPRYLLPQLAPLIDSIASDAPPSDGGMTMMMNSSGMSCSVSRRALNHRSSLLLCILVGLAILAVSAGRRASASRGSR